MYLNGAEKEVWLGVDINSGVPSSKFIKSTQHLVECHIVAESVTNKFTHLMATCDKYKQYSTYGFLLLRLVLMLATSFWNLDGKTKFNYL